MLIVKMSRPLFVEHLYHTVLPGTRAILYIVYEVATDNNLLSPTFVQLTLRSGILVVLQVRVTFADSCTVSVLDDVLTD